MKAILLPLAGVIVSACAAEKGPDCGLVDQEFRGPCASLSQYGLVSVVGGGISFAPQVVPYDLNSPLFSDYAVKVRGVVVPRGMQATYDPVNAFGFPAGTVFVKSFGFAADRRAPDSGITWVETRLLVNAGDAGWEPYDYLWNDAGSDAVLTYAGASVPLSWINADGGEISTLYPVPTSNQCKQCHNLGGAVTPIGPKARQINKSFGYASGIQNQLEYWSDAGILSGAPDPVNAPSLASPQDPTSGTLEARARAYLEGNCAHCHNADGDAFTTGLYLWASESDPTRYGVCKTPVAAGPGSGGFAFDVVPGEPQDSIMIFRMSSTTPEIMMPQIGRSIADEEGVTLVSQWIAGLEGNCR